MLYTLQYVIDIILKKKLLRPPQAIYSDHWNEDIKWAFRPISLEVQNMISLKCKVKLWKEFLVILKKCFI